MATWPGVPVEHPGLGGTAVLTPDVGGPRAPIEEWVVLGAIDRSDHQAHRGVGPARIEPDRREPEPPSGLAPVRPRLDLLRRDESTIAICEVIAAWRAADRELAGLVAGDRRAGELDAEISGLRDLHHRLFAARARPSSSGLGDRLSSWSADVGAWLSPSSRPVTT